MSSRVLKHLATGRLLQRLIDMRPLNEALEDLRRISTRHHEVVVMATFESVTNIMGIVAGRFLL